MLANNKPQQNSIDYAKHLHCSPLMTNVANQCTCSLSLPTKRQTGRALWTHDTNQRQVNTTFNMSSNRSEVTLQRATCAQIHNRNRPHRQTHQNAKKRTAHTLLNPLPNQKPPRGTKAGRGGGGSQGPYDIVDTLHTISNQRKIEV
jgi:hypothetical protein